MYRTTEPSLFLRCVVRKYMPTSRAGTTTVQARHGTSCAHANPCFPTIRNAPTSANADQKARVCPLTAEVGLSPSSPSEYRSGCAIEQGCPMNWRHSSDLMRHQLPNSWRSTKCKSLGSKY